MMISERDFVLQRKVWKNFPEENTYMMHSKSIVLSEVPEVKKFTRGHTEILAFYIKEISNSPLKCKFISVEMNDLKGSIPNFMLNKVASNKPKNFLEKLTEGLSKLKKKGK